MKVWKAVSIFFHLQFHEKEFLISTKFCFWYGFLSASVISPHTLPAIQ
jgi:hypothetical protein